MRNYGKAANFEMEWMGNKKRTPICNILHGWKPISMWAEAELEVDVIYRKRNDNECPPLHNATGFLLYPKKVLSSVHQLSIETLLSKSGSYIVKNFLKKIGRWGFLLLNFMDLCKYFKNRY